jgi:hypothetical protein
MRGRYFLFLLLISMARDSVFAQAIYQTGNSKEFNSSIFHHTGGLQIGFGF